MNEQAARLEAEDAAWASINTPLSVTELKEFCRDIERLYRINPMLEFTRWQILADNQFNFSGKNISQETPFNFDVTLKVDERPDGYEINYDHGIKSSTTFSIEIAPQGSKLTVIDRYEGLSEEERKSKIDEVDKSITIWASYLQKYLVSWHKWSRFAPWRWYMRRVWQPMKPGSRRIAYMLLWISVIEIAVILLAVAIYYNEHS
jgi:hypothetical protein